MERHCSQVIRGAGLWCRRLQVRIPGWVRCLLVNSLYQSSSEWEALSRLPKLRDGLCISFAIPKIQSLLLQPLDFGKQLPFVPIMHLGVYII